MRGRPGWGPRAMLTNGALLQRHVSLPRYDASPARILGAHACGMPQESVLSVKVFFLTGTCINK
jgi:hypothetical protein